MVDGESMSHLHLQLFQLPSSSGEATADAAGWRGRPGVVMGEPEPVVGFCRGLRTPGSLSLKTKRVLLHS